ncbi:glycosyltransferase [Pseudomonas daroniae]|nr:glycosyltransferase [Pseudomonas daroniae]
MQDALLAELREVQSPTTLGFLNQHGYNIAHNDPTVRRNFMRMNYLLRDGIGVKMACKFNGRDPQANLNGTDFIPELIEHLSYDTGRFQFFALGTQEPWLSEGAERLFKGQPFTAADGFREVSFYPDFVAEHLEPGKIPVIVLAMGMPKQEDVAARLQRMLVGPALMICGGAIIDFSAQRFSRAPLPLRKIGLEWAYRLLIEPRRLFKRYIIGIPQFFYFVLRNGRASDAVRVGEQGAYNRKS